VDIVLSRSEFTTEEIARKTVTLQSNKDFSVTFETKDLKEGQYKVEVPEIQDYAFLGGSVTIRSVKVIDRSREVVIKSPQTQDMDGSLDITGTIPNNPNAGVQMKVVGPENEIVFGPQYIATSSQGSFSQSIPINKSGTYQVSFTDSRGFIGTYMFTVNDKPAITISPTTEPTMTKALTVTARSSATNPAYFVITGIEGTVNISTSVDVDWVIEYADERGIVQKVNSKGRSEPEVLTVDVSGDTLYLKVYPYLLSESGDVTISVEGAQKIELATGIPTVFAPTSTPTQKSPLLLFSLRSL